VLNTVYEDSHLPKFPHPTPCSTILFLRAEYCLLSGLKLKLKGKINYAPINSITPSVIDPVLFDTVDELEVVAVERQRSQRVQRQELIANPRMTPVAISMDGRDKLDIVCEGWIQA
jgi:hypothetical protein